MAGTMQTADGFASAFFERFDKGSLCYWITCSNTRIHENRRQPACGEAITLPGEEKEGAGRALAGISVSCQRHDQVPILLQPVEPEVGRTRNAGVDVN